MKTKLFPLVARLALTLLVGGAAAVQAASIVGALSNFDINNNTGSSVDGFELELYNVSPADLLGTWNYNPHYHQPLVTNSASGTLVIYKGDTNNITPAGAIEHFGAILPAFPTNGITYCWTHGGVRVGAPAQFPLPVVTVVPLPATPTESGRHGSHREIRNPDSTNTFWVERASIRTNREVSLDDLMTTNDVIVATTNLDDHPKRLRPGDRLSDDDVIAGDDSQSEVLSLRIYSDNHGNPGPLIGTFMSAAVTRSRSRAESIHRGHDGRTRVGFAVEPGTNYVVQVSDDMVHWVNAGVIQTNSATAQYQDDSATNRPTRYYRLLQP